MHKPKIAIILSHPVQHFCPQFSSFAKWDEWELKVFFASSLGHKEYESPGFKTKVSWRNLKLEEFSHKFLNDGKVIMIDKSLDAPDLDAELTEFDPEALIVYGYWQKYQRRALNWAESNNKKILYISDSELLQKRNFLLKPIKYLFLRKYFKNIDAFLTVGDANEDFYATYGVPRSKFFRAPFSIDIENYKSSFTQKEALREEMRNALGIEKEEIVCSVVGKLVSWKRQDDIIDALGQLENSKFRFTLIVIGSGTMQDAWRAQATKIKKNKVLFTNFVDAHDLPKYYACSDIYIHPAEKEPHTLAVSEAIYMGCPIILSDKCGSYGPTDDVQPNINGFVYPCADVMRLAECMETLAADPVLRRQFGDASHKHAIHAQTLSHGQGLKSALTACKVL